MDQIEEEQKDQAEYKWLFRVVIIVWAILIVISIATFFFPEFVPTLAEFLKRIGGGLNAINQS